MKISDPLGKVYTHTMFKKRSYDMKERERSDPKYSKHHQDKSVSEDEEEDEDHPRPSHEEEEEDEDHSIVSDQSDDSLSTKSSRLVHGGSHRQSTGRRGISSVSFGRLHLYME